MAQYIPKELLLVEIEKHLSYYKDLKDRGILSKEGEAAYRVVRILKSDINSLEVKEVDELFECPIINIEDDVSVSSRMKHIDEDLKPIADFILEYASWNLHKGEWNHPVLEVPLFRVLDALIQRGTPYCENC